MAKMFYTVEEAASRLGMSEGEVEGLGESGQLQEFRDRDRLMFKKDQVDLLAGDEIEEDDIQLADTGELEPMSLSASGTGSAFGMSSASASNLDASDTGISIFDPDESDMAGENDDTLITGASGVIGLADSGASGSGLAQLALESDDTSLGGTDLLADLGGDSALDMSGPGESSLSGISDDLGGTGGGALFEGGIGETDFGVGAAAASAALIPMGEAYDGPWSGIAGGAAVGMTLVLLASIAATILSLTGSGAASLLGSIDDTMLMAIAGGSFVLILVCAVIGWFLLRKS